MPEGRRRSGPVTSKECPAQHWNSGSAQRVAYGITTMACGQTGAGTSRQLPWPSGPFHAINIPRATFDRGQGPSGPTDGPKTRLQSTSRYRRSLSLRLGGVQIGG